MRRGSLSKAFMSSLTILGSCVALAACGSSKSSTSSASNSSTGSGSSSSASGKSVVMVGVAPVISGDWEPANYGTFTAMAKKYGFKYSNQESVSYDQAASVFSRLAPTTNVIIADSGGYESSVSQVAPKFPNTWFLRATIRRTT